MPNKRKEPVSRTKNMFVRLHCPKCDKFLGEIMIGTDGYCNKCAKWIKAGETNELD